MTKTIGYIRVSTDKQDYNNQKYEILSYCDREKWQIDQWIELEMSSRRSAKDRQIDDLMMNLEAGDRLIVSELSRLGRSTGEVIQLVKELADRKIEFVAIKQHLHIDARNGQDITTKVMITFFSLMAELERDMISDRTKNALARAKASGKKLGRPRGKGKSKLDGKEAEIKALLDKGVSRASIAKMLGVSWGTVDGFVKTKF